MRRVSGPAHGGGWRRSWLAAAFTALLLTTVGAPAEAQIRAAPKSAPRPQVAALGNIDLFTANGTNVVAPRGWGVKRSGAAIVLEAPEGGSFITFNDAVGGDADAAVAGAWAAYGVKTVPPLRRARDLAIRDGWDQMRQYAYAPIGNAPRTIYARALRKGDRWTTYIHDVADDLADKRDAQIEVIFGHLYPAGHVRESFAGRRAHEIDAARLALLVRTIETGQRELDIPGVGFGLVQNGRVVFAGGFGVRTLGRPERIDADTAFMIGSNGKALSTLMLAKLVEAGRLDWETTVVSIWPEFRLGDAATTAQVRVKHLVCACTGLPRKDLVWLFQGHESQPATVLKWLSETQPTSAFGELYQYSNLLAAAGGFLGGHIAHPDLELGAAFDKAMQDLVFDPLGMTNTTFDYARAYAGNHAAGHALDVDGVQQIADMGLNEAGIPTRPDGGEWSTVRDMLRYVQMELARGRLPNGERYIAEAPLLSRRIPQVSGGSDEYYGMGLKIDEIWGVPVVHHGGSQYGYQSEMIWLPDQDVGVVILTNADTGAALRSGFRRRLLEVLFDGELRADTDFNNYLVAFKANRGKERTYLTQPADAVAVTRLAARYANPELGELKVQRDGGKVFFDLGGWRSEIATRTQEDGTVVYVTVTPGLAGYEFEASGGAQTGQLIIREAPRAYAFEVVR